MSVLTNLLILIVAARLMGRLFVRFGQPAIVGEMLAGIILGPSTLNFVQMTPALSGLSELAVFLVILSAGLEMNYEDITTSFRGRGIGVAVLAFFIPFVSGTLVADAFGLDTMRVIFVGLCVSITALPVAVRILESFNMLESRIAKLAVATAIINDVAALLILGVILNLPEQRTLTAIGVSVLITGGKLLLLVGVIWAVNRFLSELRGRGVSMHIIPEKLVEMFGNEALFGLTVAFVLMFGSLSEILGFHFVIGSFFGALLISKDFFLAKRYRELEGNIASISSGFLSPLFFASLGLDFRFHEMRSFYFTTSVLAVSIASKVVAGYIGGRFAKMSHREAFGLGVILNGRGVMEMVVAGIALKRGFIQHGLFSTLILMGVVTTLITPIWFRRYNKKAAL